MTLPPALSWMHLFARDASFACQDDAPAAMRALIGSAGLPAGRQTVVVGGSLPEKADAFVGINARVTRKQLTRAGFSYVRRFAVLPDLTSARWYVPLDNPAVSSAAFSLYSPAKRSARLKVTAARIATYSRLPIWYRDQIIIAQPAPPPIERKMSDLLGGIELRLALSSGAPEPARNRKVSIAVIGIDGGIIGFAKVAGSDLSSRLLRDESRVLPELSARGIASPKLIFAGEVDGAFVTLQKPLKGKPVTPALTTNKRVLLASLRSATVQTASQSDMILTLIDRVTELRSSHPQLHDALEGVLPILSEMHLPSTIVHGDFAPWNLREHDGAIAAFDWEYARVDGLPLIDEVHYQLQVGYLLDHWDLSKAVAFLRDMQQMNDLSLPVKHVRALQIIYLIDNLARLFAEGYDEHENQMVGWYCQLLSRLAVPRREMVIA
jgi:phosphotransferase family enzyme